MTAFRALCAAGAALFCVSASQADTATLTPLVVTPTRIPTALDDVAAPVTVIDRERIERSGAQDLAQLLRFVAGADIGRNGGPGQTASIFLRGAESNHTLVLIDGVRMNPGTIGGAAIQNIDPDMIERVEIVKGPRSSLYGSEAIGGVINVITRREPGERELELRLGGGRYGTVDASLAAGGELGDTAIDAAIGYFASDGFAARTGATSESGTDSLSARLHVERSFGAVEASARLWRSSGNTEYLDFFSSPLDQDFTNQVAGLSLSAPLGESLTSTLDVSHSVDDIEQQQSSDFVETRRLAVELRNTLALANGHTLLAGFYMHREDTSALVFGSGFDEDTDLFAVFIEDNYQRGAHHASVAARYTDHDGFGGETTWHLDYGFALSDTLTATAGASTGFRAPDATDRFGFGGNPDLEPETSLNLELGLRADLSARQRVGLNVFSLSIDDLIVFDFDPVTFAGQNRNIDEARIRGVELRYEYDAGDRGLIATAVLQDPENEVSGNRLPRRAERSASVNAWQRFGRFELGAELLASGERKDSDFSDTVNAGYVLANLTARTELGRSLELRTRIENLLDTDYETAAGFNTPGRGLYIDLLYRPR